MTFYLGIDAGGTKTTCVIADEHSMLARATAGSIKVMRVSEDEAAANLNAVLEGVTTQSGVSLSDITSTCIGLAGITVSRVEQWTRKALQAHVSGSLELCGDEEIALDGAFFGSAGVLVLAGTGSNIVGRTESGEGFHLGGWGPVLSDEGSGYWIGLQAVRAVLRTLERNVPTLLLAAILAEWKISTSAELVDMGNRTPGPDFSLLAPIVAQCASEGDAAACAVLQQAGKELGAMAVEALGKVRAAFTSGDAPLRLAFAGSVMENIPQVREALVTRVQRAFPGVTLQAEPVDAVMGALWRARRLTS